MHRRPCTTQVLTSVDSDAMMSPFPSFVVSVEGALLGAASGGGSSMPGRGSVRGASIREEPPNSFPSQLTEEDAVSDSAGTALAAEPVLKARRVDCACSPRWAPAQSILAFPRNSR